MNRDMRRKNQQLTQAEAEQVLARGTSGVLALCGSDGEPYAVPLSYAWREGHLYFHCALSGHKMDLLAQNPHASFCVIDQDQVVPASYTTYFRSAIAFGNVRVLLEPDEKRQALLWLAERYAPDQPALHAQEIDKFFERTLVLDMAIDRLTGKEARELRPPQGSPG